jgi:predicted amidophosphoribosyltransferase
MTPFAIYLLLVAGASLIGAGALLFARDPQRACPGCGEAISTSARACRRCRYRLTA